MLHSQVKTFPLGYMARSTPTHLAHVVLLDAVRLRLEYGAEKVDRIIVAEHLNRLSPLCVRAAE